MIEIRDTREMHLERKIWAMILSGLKEGIVMIEKVAESGLVIGTGKDLGTVIGSVLEIVTVTVKGITVSVTDTEKTGTDMQIIIGIEMGKQSMMMSGRGDGHQGHIANRGYHKRRNTILGREMLIMGRGDGLLLNNFPAACFFSVWFPLREGKKYLKSKDLPFA